jgi:hypothetical protein
MANTDKSNSACFVDPYSGMHVIPFSSLQFIFCIFIFLCEIFSFLLQLDAIKLAGVTKKNYTSSRHTIEKLLGIGKCITIKDLCVQFGVSEAMSLAQKLLEKYVEGDIISNTNIHVKL